MAPCSWSSSSSSLIFPLFIEYNLPCISVVQGVLITTSLIFALFREYYLLIYAYEDFDELLVTAIVDTPPELDDESIAKGPGFTIQRMGRPN